MDEEPEDKDHEKHAQLGADLTTGDEETLREPLSEEERDALWADATTVEGFAEGLAGLQELEPEVVEALKAARG